MLILYEFLLTPVFSEIKYLIDRTGILRIHYMRCRSVQKCYICLFYHQSVQWSAVRGTAMKLDIISLFYEFFSYSLHKTWFSYAGTAFYNKYPFCILRYDLIIKGIKASACIASRKNLLDFALMRHVYTSKIKFRLLYMICKSLDPNHNHKKAASPHIAHVPHSGIQKNLPVIIYFYQEV